MESANESGAVSSRKPIYSRWIRTDLAGDSYTRSVANRILRQAYQGVQTIPFELELKDEDLALGEIFELTSKDVVDIDGQQKIEKWQVIKKQKSSRGRTQYLIVNTRLKKRYLFIAPNGTPDYITYSAGPGTIGTTGINATFSVAHGLSIGDYAKLTSGAQSGETRRVSAIPSATTATLESPFSADQLGQNWNKGVLATASQREYGFVSNNSGKMSNGDDGYLII